MSSCSPERAVGPSWNARRGPRRPPSIEFYPGSDLLSHAVASAVPSAQEGLTSVFGMGTGVAPPATPPGTLAAVIPPPNTETLWSIARRCISHVSEMTRNNRGQAARAISTGQLNALRRLHLRPINLVIYEGPSEGLRPGRSHLQAGFALRCLQRLSLPDIATERCSWRNSSHTRGPSTPVLSY